MLDNSLRVLSGPLNLYILRNFGIKNNFVSEGIYILAHHRPIVFYSGLKRGSTLAKGASIR